jgi:hypothetical protein
MPTKHAMEQRTTRTVGALLMAAPLTIMAVSYGIIWPLVGGIEPPQAAHNIVRHEAFFRAGVVGNLLYTTELVWLSAATFVMLRPIDPLLALLAALGRLFHAITWVVVCLNLFAALRLLTDAEYARAIPADELPVLARLFLSGFDRYYVALLFWSLGTMVAARAWWRLGAIPPLLAACGVMSGAWAVFCTVSLLLVPTFQTIVHLAWFDVPLVVFELSVGVLLVYRGLPHGAHLTG